MATQARIKTRKKDQRNNGKASPFVDEADKRAAFDDDEADTSAVEARVGWDDDEGEDDEATEAMAQLRQTLRLLGNDVRGLLKELPTDMPLPGLDPARVEEGLQQAETFLQKPAFVVGFAGGFNAGKSMLINALLGQHILKDGAAPTTSTVTRIVACKPGQEQMVIHFFTPSQFEDLFDRYHADFAELYEQNVNEAPHGRDELTELLEDIKYLQKQLEDAEWNTKTRGLDSFYDLVLAYVNHKNMLSSRPVIEPLTRKNLLHYTTKADNSVSPLVREVQLEINHPMLAEGSELIDLPGLGSPDPRDEEITVAALKGDEDTGKRECDAVVHVMDALSPFRAGEDRLFQIYRRVWGESFAKRVFLVVSRWGKLEQEVSEEMLTVAQTLRRVVERYHVEGKKVFIVDGRTGSQYEPGSQNDDEVRDREIRRRGAVEQELRGCELPSGQNLFDVTIQTTVDGNVPALRESLRYYLAFYKEYLHLADAMRMLETQVNRIQQITSLNLPPLEQLDDDEERFIEECRSDIDRQLKSIRGRTRNEIQRFLQSTLRDEVLPRELGNLFEGFYQASSQRLEQQDPDALMQELMTSQISGHGPLTTPGPWEAFRFLLKQEVTRLDEEVEQFCSSIIDQILHRYQSFLFEELGLMVLLERAFGETPEGRKVIKSFQDMIQQLGHDLRLIARNLNRIFFYEYSDVYHRRDHLDALVNVREELEEQFQHDLHMGPGDARNATRWLLRQKMDYHARKLATYLPLCFLQQLQELHNGLTDLLDTASFSIRQSYLERLERREIGYEVDRIRHRYRQIRVCLEHLQIVRSRMHEARQILQTHRPTN
ncbi:MAG: dynamin family protein [Myxococcales bacterium]|nr:dynamin family protein [Myxococcales bacterium]